MKILITGAAGYLGRGLVKPFLGKHELRLMDVADWQAPAGKLIGSVADLDLCRKAMQGMDAVVIAHMATRQTGSYETPVLPFDINVKGTANLFFAAVEQKVSRVCLISSTGAVSDHPEGTFQSRDLALRGKDIYSLTKVCQEVVADHYHRIHGIKVAIQRVAWIVDADTCVSKYGEKLPHWSPGMVDPRDMGEAARLALELPDLDYEIFYVSGTPGSDKTMDVAHTCKRLKWKPRYDFSNLPSLEEFKRSRPASAG